MTRLEDYFSNHQIIHELCKLRIKLAKKRHNQQFLYNISKDAPFKSIEKLNEDEQKIYKMFPPRHQWHRPKLEDRKNQSATQINIIALKITVLQKFKQKKCQNEPWLINLKSFIKTIQEQALKNNNFEFTTPKIIRFPKSKNKYRPIAQYNLVEKIIDKLCAKYLVTILDSDFLDESYAFRKDKNIQRNQAIEKLIKYKEKYKNQPLWISECDLQKFFDCIHHKNALEALDAAIKRLKNSNKSVSVDERAIFIFKKYLESYSFKRVAEQEGKGGFDWPEAELRKFWNNNNDELQKIGVPQGGAISCLIVNLVLDYADRRVLKNSKKPDLNLFYARYCDDIIIIHPDKNKCKNAFDRYIRALNKQKLLYHKPHKWNNYSKKFWDGKTKLPYQWSSSTENNSAPWASFLGYQIRYDGLLRVRPSSIKKELEKQVKEADKILKYVCPSQKQGYSSGVRRNQRQIRYRLLKRLISMSVGKKGFHDSCTFCWCNGFKALKGQKFVDSQLKKLDRGRERQIRRVERHLKDLIVESHPNKKKIKIKYFGKPFSYYGQFL